MFRAVVLRWAVGTEGERIIPITITITAAVIRSTESVPCGDCDPIGVTPRDDDDDDDDDGTDVTDCDCRAQGVGGGGRL